MRKQIISVHGLFLLLVGAVFIYTPGDVFLTHILGTDGLASDVITWVVYGSIFAYYIIATIFPIDKIIGKVYPIFGAVFILSALGIFVGMLVKGYPLTNLNADNILNMHPDGLNFFSIFFVTVACGIGNLCREKTV